MIVFFFSDLSQIVNKMLRRCRLLSIKNTPMLCRFSSSTKSEVDVSIKINQIIKQYKYKN